MAKDNDKGLYLPLKINLSEWEKSLAQADADLQKSMRQMKDASKDLSLQFDVKIANAKAAGDQLKVIELENAKLNQLYATQKQAVEALNRAYQQSVKDKGASAKESQAIANALVRESKQLDRLKTQIESKGLNIGQSISNGLAGISPQFAKIRGMVGGITGALTGMGGAATTAAAALGGIGLAAAGIGAVYTGLEKITNGVNDLAKAGVKASDPIYQLRESMQSTYEEAEYFYRVTAVDGSNAESLVNSITNLDKALLKDKEGTSLAAQTLEKFGASLFTAEGRAKSYKEQLRELSRAAQLAASVGQYTDFKAALPGAFRTTEFDHLLLGLENYETKAKAATSATKVYYEELHELSDWTNVVAEAQRQLDAVKGGIFAGAAVENLKYEADTLKATAIIIDENREAYERLGIEVGNITNSWTDFKGTAAIAWESVKADIVTATKYLSGFTGMLGKAADVLAVFNPAKPILDYLGEKMESARAQINATRELVKAEREAEAAKAKTAEQNKNLGTVKDIKWTSKEEETASKKRAAAQERFAKELRDATSTDYQRQINALEDKRKAYIAEGVAEVDANKLFAAQKAAIDKQYFDKVNAEQQKQVKSAEDGYMREAEAAKKARESAISDAESTLKSNLKVLRYANALMKRGTYDEDKVKAYADRLYMRQNGFRQSDITALREIGVDKLKDFGNARDRIFGQFADISAPPPVTNNNNTTVNNYFDNTVVEDVSAMDKLANKVAAIITPTIERALRGGAQYQY